MNQKSIPVVVQKNSMKLNKIYTFLLISFPILFNYGVGLGTLTLADVMVLCINIVFLFKISIFGKIKIDFKLLPFFIYILVTIIFHKCDNSVLMRTFRYIFYIINIVFFIRTYFDYTFGVKVYKIISLVSTYFLFIQIAFYKLFGIYIPGVIISANLVITDLYEYSNILHQAQTKRFMAFFAEPSHYAIYVLGYLTILLFTKKNNSKSIKKGIFQLSILSLGILLSTSILGVAVLVAMSSIWIALNLIKGKKNFIKITIIIIVIIIPLVIFVSYTDSYAYFTNTNVIRRQAGGRFEGYKILNHINSNISLKLFGRGMVKNDSGLFLASYPLLVYYFGYFGLFLFLIPFIIFFLKHKFNVSIALLICLFGISIGSEILLGMFILVFLPFIIGKDNNNVIG